LEPNSILEYEKEISFCEDLSDETNDDFLIENERKNNKNPKNSKAKRKLSKISINHIDKNIFK